MPGSAPPTTPISVPRNSGTRYFSARMFAMPAARSSYIAGLEPGPAPAREQYEQVALEHEVGDAGSQEREREQLEPALRAERPREQRSGRRDVEEGRDAEAEAGEREHVCAEDGEARQHQRVVRLRRDRRRARRRSAAAPSSEHVADHDQHRESGGDGDDDARIEAGADRDERVLLQAERHPPEARAEREDDESRPAVAADHSVSDLSPAAADALTA